MPFTPGSSTRRSWVFRMAVTDSSFRFSKPRLSVLKEHDLSCRVNTDGKAGPRYFSLRTVVKPIFNLAQPVQSVCREGKAADLLAQLAAYRLDLVLADEPAPSSLPIKVFNHLLGECGVTFCAEPKLAATLKRNFPKSLNDAPVLLPASNAALRQSLEKWFQAEGLRPRLVAEFDDAALMKVAAVDGLGFFAVPTLVAKEAITRYGFQPIGRTEDCRQQFYAISAERKLTHPAVVAITSQAKARLLG